MSGEKTICIVGVAGFIGSHLLEKIIRERTWNVVGCDEKSQGHAFNVGNPDNNIKVSALAEMMINMYSEITGKPKGTTRTVSGVEYYGPGYEDSDLRIPSMRLIQQQLGWTPPTSLKSAMEATMKVFIEKYADKVQALKRTSDEAEPAAKKAKA